MLEAFTILLRQDNKCYSPGGRKRGHRILQYIPHKQDWLYRSPYFFFKAIQQLNNTDPSIGNKIKDPVCRKNPRLVKDMIRSFGLENQVTLMGEISHKESLSFQESCDALLITSAKQIGGRDYSIAGKDIRIPSNAKTDHCFCMLMAHRKICLKKEGRP